MLSTLETNPKLTPKASVIWLHGLGASGHDFYNIVPQLNLPKELAVRFVFPHAPVRPVQFAGGVQLRAWFDVYSLNKHAKEDEAGIRESENLIGELIAKEREIGVPSHKIILIGFSQGGAIALHTGLRYPEKLAGIFSLSSWLPLVKKVADERTKINREIPILMFHGTDDDMVPFEWAKDSYDSLVKMGYSPKLFSYPMQHVVCDEEIKMISDWFKKLLI